MPAKKKAETALEEIFTKALGKTSISESPDWGDADPAILHRLISAVVAVSGLVSFSKAQKGSAFVLTIMHDMVAVDDRKHYITGSAELNETLMRHVDVWEAIREQMTDAGLI